MKIDSNRTGLDPLGTLRTEATETQQTPGQTRPSGAAPSDHVDLSAGAKLAGAAARAVSDLPDVRADAVAKAKALLATGELGANPTRLADAIIDRLISGE